MNARPLAVLAFVLSSCGPEPTLAVVAVDDAMGLHTGDPVRSAGVDVGRVRRVELRSGQAWVAFSVRPDVDLVVGDTCAAVEARGLLGEAMLTLRPVEEDLLAEREPDEIRACPPEPGLADATAPLVAAASSLSDLLEGATSGRGTLARLLTDEALADALVAAVERGCAPAVPPALEPFPEP